MGRRLRSENGVKNGGTWRNIEQPMIPTKAGNVKKKPFHSIDTNGKEIYEKTLRICDPLDINVQSGDGDQF